MLTNEIFGSTSKSPAASVEKKLYIARITIHVPHLEGETYGELYEVLDNKGLTKAISREGEDYVLPDAVYATNAPPGMAAALTQDIFQAVKDATGDMHPEVLIVEVEDIDFLGLAKVTDRP